MVSCWRKMRGASEKQTERGARRTSRHLCARRCRISLSLSWNYGLALESLGSFGVYLFFAISGAVMVMQYGPSFSRGITKQDTTDFFRARFARIMPLLATVAIIAIFFEWLVTGRPLQEHLAQGLLTATGLFGLGPPGRLSNTTGAWSLGIELLFYALFPVACLLFANAGARRIAAGLLVLVAAQQIYVWSIASVTEMSAWWQLYVHPITFAPFFLIGMIVSRHDGGKSTGAAAAAVAVLAIVAVYSIALSVDVYRSPVHFLILTALSASCLWLSYRAAIPSLARPLILFLAEISYSLYLTHWLAEFLAAKLSGASPLPKDLLFPPLAIALAAAVTWGIEKPAKRFLRRRSSSDIVKHHASAGDVARGEDDLKRVTGGSV